MNSAKKKNTSKSLLDQEIAKSLQDTNRKKGIKEETLKLTEEQEELIAFIRDALGLSQTATINSCIKYVIFYIEKKGVKLGEIPQYPTSIGLRSLEFRLSAETSLKLEKAEINNQIIECAVAGIQLLHERLSVECE